jgi:hypothetical protein
VNLTDWEALPNIPLPRDANFWLGSRFHNFGSIGGIFFGLVGSFGFHWEWSEYNFYIMTSTDGVRWTTRFVQRGLTDLAGENGRLLALDWAGKVFESDPLLSLHQGGAGDLVIRRASGIPTVVEFSEDLGPWQTLTNLPPGGPLETVRDPAGAKSAARFYRARAP